MYKIRYRITIQDYYSYYQINKKEMKRSNKNISCCKTSFTMSKIRVASLKKITLPRHEFLVALTAAKLANYLKDLEL